MAVIKLRPVRNFFHIDSFSLLAVNSYRQLQNGAIYGFLHGIGSFLVSLSGGATIGLGIERRRDRMALRFFV
jgi:hypothetical protein